MEILIKGAPEEVAALVVAIQERQIDIAEEKPSRCFAENTSNRPLVLQLSSGRKLRIRKDMLTVNDEQSTGKMLGDRCEIHAGAIRT